MTFRKSKETHTHTLHKPTKQTTTGRNAGLVWPWNKLFRLSSVSGAGSTYHAYIHICTCISPYIIYSHRSSNNINGE